MLQINDNKYKYALTSRTYFLIQLHHFGVMMIEILDQKPVEIDLLYYRMRELSIKYRNFQRIL